METNLNAKGEVTETTPVSPEVYERVVEIVAETLGKPEGQFIADTVLSEHADSLDIVDIIMALEEEFEIRVPDEEAQGLLTVGQIAQYVATRLAAMESAHRH